MKTGIAHLPLHTGKAPAWLFQRMKALGREIILVLLADYGPHEVLRRLADPYWFQALGCALGFDWHSSGLTTTVGGALKEGLNPLAKETGFAIAGGKGGTSRKTPNEIEAVSATLHRDPTPLIYASRMAAKVDNTALQDGYQLYHHLFVFTRDGRWAVIQQGMNTEERYARRYHWLGEQVQDFVCEPESAICCDQREAEVLNLVAAESAGARTASTLLSRESPDRLLLEVQKLTTLALPARHAVALADLNPKHLRSVFSKTYEASPENFEALLGLPGVGPKTLRALALLSELIHGAPPSSRDPARYSFAHGGKDGHPYPVCREAYDTSIDFLRRALRAAKIGHTDKLRAFRRLERTFAP
ncbi:MAG: DUF763 domain-containing protein [Candidatus Methylomirabilales bacterium]